MGPRVKGKTLDFFPAADDITDLTVEHDRDNRLGQRGGPGMGRDGGYGGYGGGDGGYGRGRDDGGYRGRDSGYRSRGDDSRAPRGEGEQGNWRANRPPSTRTPSGLGGSSAPLGGGAGMSDFVRGPPRMRETAAAPATNPTPGVVKKFNFGSINNTISEANAAVAPAMEKAIKSQETSTSTPAVAASTAPANRWAALDTKDTDRRREMGDSVVPHRKLLEDTKARKAAEEAKITAELKAQAAKAQALKLAEQQAAEKAAAERAAAEQAAAEKKAAEERAAAEKAEAARQKLAVNTKLMAGKLLRGSVDDIRTVATTLEAVYEGTENVSAEHAMNKLIEEVPLLKESTLPLAVAFALYLRRVMDAAASVADSYDAKTTRQEPEEDEEEEIDEELVNSLVESTVVPAAEEYSDCLNNLLVAFRKHSTLSEEDFALAKLQELARTSGSCGLSRLSSTKNFVTIVYQALLKNGAISTEEFLAWNTHPKDTSEKRNDALARVVGIARSLKGLDVAPENIAPADDDADSVDDE